MEQASCLLGRGRQAGCLPHFQAGRDACASKISSRATAIQGSCQCPKCPVSLPGSAHPLKVARSLFWVMVSASTEIAFGSPFCSLRYPPKAAKRQPAFLRGAKSASENSGGKQFESPTPCPGRRKGPCLDPPGTPERIVQGTSNHSVQVATQLRTR